MRFASGLLTLLILGTPLLASAFPFGGQISTVVPCYNQAIFARIGAPRGGDFIWTPATKTYQFGPPSFSGQWLLGLASAPYYCIVSIEPLIVWPGIAIDMMGSSGSAAPTIRQLLSGGTVSPTPQPPTTPTPAPTVTQPTSIGHIVVSEVYYNVDSAHGGKTLNQWVELFNGTKSSVDVSGWTIQNAGAQTAVPPGSTLSSGQFLIIFGSASSTAFWSIPATAKVVSLGGLIDGGLSTASDAVILKNPAGALVDAVSWGTNKSGFASPLPPSLSGYSLSRKSLVQDTDTANDWSSSSVPTPGK
jgi:hypothetical protein